MISIVNVIDLCGSVALFSWNLIQFTRIYDEVIETVKATLDAGVRKRWILRESVQKRRRVVTGWLELLLGATALRFLFGLFGLALRHTTWFTLGCDILHWNFLHWNFLHGSSRLDDLAFRARTRSASSGCPGFLGVRDGSGSTFYGSRFGSASLARYHRLRTGRSGLTTTDWSRPRNLLTILGGRTSTSAVGYRSASSTWRLLLQYWAGTSPFSFRFGGHLGLTIASFFSETSPAGLLPARGFATWLTNWYRIPSSSPLQTASFLFGSSPGEATALPASPGAPATPSFFSAGAFFSIGAAAALQTPEPALDLSAIFSEFLPALPGAWPSRLADGDSALFLVSFPDFFASGAFDLLLDGLPTFFVSLLLHFDALLPLLETALDLPGRALLFPVSETDRERPPLEDDLDFWP